MNDYLYILGFVVGGYATYLLLMLAEIWRIKRQIKDLERPMRVTTPVTMVGGCLRPGISVYDDHDPRRTRRKGIKAFA